jgi:hypothetical protein
MTNRSAIIIYDQWGWGAGTPYADQVHEGDQPSESKLLGPDGRPLRYAPRKIGFDLTPRKKGEPA